MSARSGSTILLLAFAMTPALQAPALGQTTEPLPTTVSATGGRPAVQFDPDLRVDPVEPEFALASLPTTLRMPDGKFVFRLTHRFSRPIAQGDAGDFLADFFGFDSSAKVGLELRYGVRAGTQATVYRTNDRSIQLLAQQELIRQRDSGLLTAHAVLAVEGADNFSDDFGVAVGAVLSRRLNERGVLYAQPLVVLNANPLPGEDADHEHTVMLGLGTRLRLGASRVYVVVEAAPRLVGYDAGVDHISVAIEKRYGGHVFQFSVSNNLGTTLRQLARGGPAGEDWFVGFNLIRRFF